MNKYVRAAFILPFSFVKVSFTKLFHFKNFSAPLVCMISPFTEITIDKNAKLSLGKNFKMRDGAKIRIRNGAECVIGDNSSVSINNMIACHEKIIIGDNVQFSPGVQLYDHDHDFRHRDGLKANHFKTSPIIIGNNVWIGANTIILRGTVIGDNCVVGAGSIVKGEFPKDSVIVQKRQTEIK